MFLTNYFRGLAIHQFPTPPSVVLDLGCGTGYWVIEAAKQWKACFSSLVINLLS